MRRRPQKSAAWAIWTSCSKTSSHWFVRAGLAATFYEAFYKAWLGDGLSRGGAWRAATLAGMESAQTIEEKCAACAFSLYGDWR
jgi:hypothetical protein